MSKSKKRKQKLGDRYGKRQEKQAQEKQINPLSQPLPQLQRVSNFWNSIPKNSRPNWFLLVVSALTAKKPGVVCVRKPSQGNCFIEFASLDKCIKEGIALDEIKNINFNTHRLIGIETDDRKCVDISIISINDLLAARDNSPFTTVDIYNLLEAQRKVQKAHENRLFALSLQ